MLGLKLNHGSKGGYRWQYALTFSEWRPRSVIENQNDDILPDSNVGWPKVGPKVGPTLAQPSLLSRLVRFPSMPKVATINYHNRKSSDYGFAQDCGNFSGWVRTTSRRNNVTSQRRCFEVIMTLLLRPLGHPELRHRNVATVKWLAPTTIWSAADSPQNVATAR